MRDPFTFEERVALWVLGALLACVAVAFVFAANQAGAAEAPPVPKAMPTPAPNYRTWFFAATAKDKDGLESDWSNELVWTNSVRARVVTLAWDASPSPGVTNYAVYHGRASRTYTNTTLAGTNLSVSVRLARPLLTNRLVVVSSTSTGMFYGDTMTGPWTYTSETNILTFNPSGNRFYRAVPGGAVRVTEAWL